MHTAHKLTNNKVCMYSELFEVPSPGIHMVRTSLNTEYKISALSNPY